MTCPHCQASQTLRQRRGRKCSQCQREFAFDPKGNPLALHDLRFRKKVDRLAAGGFKYAAGQLQASVEQPWFPNAGGWCPFILVGLMAAVLLTNFATFEWGGVTPGAALVAFGALIFSVVLVLIFMARFRRVTAEKFRRDYLERWRTVYGSLPNGLISEAELVAAARMLRPREQLSAVVVCPERDVLNCLLVNEVARNLQVGLLSTGLVVDEYEREVIGQLRSNPRLPILLLHDASAEGVFLAQDLPKLLGLDPNHRILDLGLNAKRSIAKGRKVVRRDVPRGLRERLGSSTVGADVAGARPLRRGRAQVSAEELAWLKSGKCSLILGLRPASLIRRVRLAMTKLKTQPEPQELPQKTVPATLGFLTWPT